MANSVIPETGLLPKLPSMLAKLLSAKGFGHKFLAKLTLPEGLTNGLIPLIRAELCLLPIGFRLIGQIK